MNEPQILFRKNGALEYVNFVRGRTIYGTMYTESSALPPLKLGHKKRGWVPCCFRKIDEDFSTDYDGTPVPYPAGSYIVLVARESIQMVLADDFKREFAED